MGGGEGGREGGRGRKSRQGRELYQASYRTGVGRLPAMRPSRSHHCVSACAALISPLCVCVRRSHRTDRIQDCLEAMCDTDSERHKVIDSLRMQFRALELEIELPSAGGVGGGRVGAKASVKAPTKPPRLHAAALAEQERAQTGGAAFNVKGFIRGEGAPLQLPPGVKACPACGMLIEKVGGDDTVMCGCEAKAAGGSYEKALRGGGCGHQFNFRTLGAVGVGRPGNPANAKQVLFFLDKLEVADDEEEAGAADAAAGGARKKQTETVLVASHGFGYAEKDVGGTIVRVFIQKIHSETQPVPHGQGLWGSRGSTLWVDKGLRAEFRVDFLPRTADGPGGEDKAARLHGLLPTLGPAHRVGEEEEEQAGAAGPRSAPAVIRQGRASAVTVTYQGREVSSCLFASGATIWSDRDGRKDKRHYRLRGVGERELLEYGAAARLFQVPHRITDKLQIKTDGSCEVVMFLLPNRRGGLPDRLKGLGWEHHDVHPLDWSNRTGDASMDRFVYTLVFRARGSQAITVPAPSSECILMLVVKDHL